jgi:hypothetical protein
MYAGPSEPSSETEVYELNPHVLDDFPVELSLEKTLERLKLDEGRSRTLGVEDVFKTAAVLIHTQAIYGAAYVNKRSLDKMEIDGIEFRSRVLAKNLERIESLSVRPDHWGLVGEHGAFI